MRGAMPAVCRPRDGGPTWRGQGKVEGDDVTMVSEMDAFCNTFQHLASLIPMKAIGERWICDDVRRSRLRDVASQLARTVFPIM
jgi:hypothetical protein